MEHDLTGSVQKQQFYDAFESLEDDENDSMPDPGRKASQNAWRATSRKSSDRVAKADISRTHTTPTSNSTVKLTLQPSADSVPAPSATHSPNPVSVRRSLPVGLTRSVSDLAPAPSRTAPTLGKRKRKTINNILPAVQPIPQIFRGLVFFFFPDNDIAPARRMRIKKAVEYGAAWEKKWNNGVTHLILDKNMDFPLVMKYLKLDRLPSKIVVVNENYPSECISYRSLLSPTQARFSVKGLELPSLAPQSPPRSLVPSPLTPRPLAPTSSTESNESLQLKLSEKLARSHRDETPSSTAEINVAASTSFQPPELQRLEQDEERIRDTFYMADPESRSEFDEAIKQAKVLRYVPLDDDEGNISRPSSSEGLQDSGDEHSTSNMHSLPKHNSKVKRWQDKFQCMQKHTGDTSSNPNRQTIDILDEMARYYDQTGDEWRTRAYRKAASTLRNHPTKICTKDEALVLPNIGDRLATKIEEIAFTNRFRRLENARAEPSAQVLQTFMKVYAAGLVQATKWVDAGYKSLDTLLQKANLTDNQRIGIEHFEDFNSRIPRAEVEQHGSVVRQALRKLDPAFEVIIGGSYRRGAKDSGDIDCILTRPNINAAQLREVVLGQLVPQLMATGFLVASLAVSSRDDGSKWHGASCLPGSKTWRRIDLLLVPSEELGAALIYFTGNDIFNRSMRLLASKKGMRLNQRGLYEHVIRGKGRMKLNEGILVEGRDERRIFEVLGVPWRLPEHRTC